MENLIEAICAALRDDAEPIARRAGLVACRKILAVLEATTDGAQATTPIAMSSSAPTPELAPAAAAALSPSSAESPAPEPAADAPPPPSTSPPSAQAPSIDPAAIATLFASLGKLPPEQLLDLAIARLRAALPPGASVPTTQPLRFQLVPLHHLRQTKP